MPWLAIANDCAYAFVTRNHVRDADRDDFYQTARLACWQADQEWHPGTSNSHNRFLVNQAWNRMLDMLAGAGYGQELSRHGYRAGLRRQTSSLDAELADTDGVTLGDTLTDDAAPFTADVDLHIDIVRALERIPARVAAIIELVDLEDVSQHDVGDGIGVSESRISQLRTDGLTKLRPLLAA